MKPVKLCCHICNYTSFHKNALDVHMHDEVKLYECNGCDFKTEHISALRRHVKNMHKK